MIYQVDHEKQAVSIQNIENEHMYICLLYTSLVSRFLHWQEMLPNVVVWVSSVLLIQVIILKVLEKTQQQRVVVLSSIIFNVPRRLLKVRD